MSRPMKEKILLTLSWRSIHHRLESSRDRPHVVLCVLLGHDVAPNMLCVFTRVLTVGLQTVPYSNFVSLTTLKRIERV